MVHLKCMPHFRNMVFPLVQDMKTFQMHHFCLGTVQVDGHAVNENVFILLVNLWHKWEILTLKNNAEELQVGINRISREVTL